MKKVSFVIIGDETKYHTIAEDLLKTNYQNLDVVFASKNKIIDHHNFRSIDFQTEDIGEISNISLNFLNGEYVVFLHTDHSYSFDYFSSLFLKINEGYHAVLISTFKLFKNLKSSFKPEKKMKCFYFNGIYGSAFNVHLIQKMNLKFLHKSDYYFLPFLHGLLFSSYLVTYISKDLYFVQNTPLKSSFDEAFLVSNLYLNETSFSKKKYARIQKKYKKLLKRKEYYEYSKRKI